MVALASRISRNGPACTSTTLTSSRAVYGTEVNGNCVLVPGSMLTFSNYGRSVLNVDIMPIAD
jgi:hypothetical protein